ncbi:Histidine-containing phosphotransfer protein 1 [Linum perenne]
MALPFLKAQLSNLVQSMFDQGMLDSQFTQIQALQDETNPTFVAEVISAFCNDAERIIIELNKSLYGFQRSYQNVDFSKVDAFLHQLKGSSSSIGAHRLKCACVDLRQASNDKNKAGSLQALHIVTREYCLVRENFETFLMIEKRIFMIETNQK